MSFVKKGNILKCKTKETKSELDFFFLNEVKNKKKEKKASPSTKPNYFKPSALLFIAILD